MKAPRGIAVLAIIALSACARRAETPGASGTAAAVARAHPPAPAPRDYQAFVAPGRAAISGLTIGTYDSTARRLLGAPLSMDTAEYEPMSDDSLYRWHYRDLDIEFTGDRITDLRCRRADCRTPDSIAVGDPRAAVVARYGPTTPDSLEGRTGLMYMVKEWACGMRFVFQRDTVVQVELRCFD